MVLEVIENLNSVALLIMVFVIYSLLIILWTKIKKEEKDIKIQENNQETISNIFSQKFIETDSEGTILTYIDYFARHLFKERFQIEESIDYITIEKNSKISNNKEIINFCNTMTLTLYSGKKVDSNTITQLIRTLEQILAKEQANLTEEEKPEFLKYLQGINLLKKLQANHQHTNHIEKKEETVKKKETPKKEEKELSHKKQVEKITKQHHKEHITAKNVSNINDLDRIRRKVEDIRKVKS